MDLISTEGLRLHDRGNGKNVIHDVGMDLISTEGLRLGSGQTGLQVLYVGRNGPDQHGGIATGVENPFVEGFFHIVGMDLISTEGLRLS